jgi:flagellar biosynthesis protein FlhG
VLAGLLDEHEFQQIRLACSHLFLGHQALDEKFLRNLTPEMVKKAHRERVKRLHPDLSSASREGKPVESFLRIQEAYELLMTYLEEEAADAKQQIGTVKKIIAVGGAKGGTGKSVFSANFGIFLASKGYRTVLVDLDLGSANLHLYLGSRSLLKRTINDFLCKRVGTFHDIIVDTRYGPLLVGGDSSELGASNLSFARKLKLMRAIRNLDADFVILDLGGDTTYNILDFFLQADYGIVVTTRDSASYIGAYHFLKAALFRKLTRLFGEESRLRGEKNPGLETLIRDLTVSSGGPKVRTVGRLLEEVKAQQPFGFALARKAVDEFNPYLVVNKVPVDVNVNPVVMKVQNVCKTYLSKEIGFLGTVSAQAEIERSALDLVPVLARHPHGKLASELDHIAKRLLGRYRG